MGILREPDFFFFFFFWGLEGGIWMCYWNHEGGILKVNGENWENNRGSWNFWADAREEQFFSLIFALKDPFPPAANNDRSLIILISMPEVLSYSQTEERFFFLFLFLFFVFVCLFVFFFNQTEETEESLLKYHWLNDEVAFYKSAVSRVFPGLFQAPLVIVVPRFLSHV